eukprot:1180698-Prorocentrum_minimum.AAC.2
MRIRRLLNAFDKTIYEPTEALLFTPFGKCSRLTSAGHVGRWGCSRGGAACSFEGRIAPREGPPLRSPWTLPTPTLTPISRLQRVEPKTKEFSGPPEAVDSYPQPYPTVQRALRRILE